MKGIKKLILGFLIICSQGIFAAEQPILIFFYSIRCPWCHQQAQVLAELNIKTGIFVVGNPIEKEGEDMMSPSKYDLELYKKLKIYSLPTVVLVLPNNSVKLVAKGFVDYATLQKRITEVLHNS